ncbi:MAG: hypothetical protein K6B41_02110 [Butyrivibrio sp.]|nr:hypothetical protein [Butyrivibrio sp.]
MEKILQAEIKDNVEENITIQLLGYITAQIITIATTMFNNYWIPIDIMIFLIVGIIFVRSKAVYHGLLFVFPLLNTIYTSGNKIIITNYSKQELRIAQEESCDGIEARELTEGVYYIRKK